MFCPMCGAPNDDEDIFCGNCGAALNPEEASDELEAVVGSEPAEEIEEEPVDGEDEDSEEVELPPRTPEEIAIEPVREPQAIVPPVPPAPPRYGQTQSVPTSGMAIASLVLGIAGLTVLPLIASVLAIIFGYMARRDIRERPGEISGEGVALAGIVTGWIGVGLAVLGVVVVGGILGCGLCGAFGAGNW